MVVQLTEQSLPVALLYLRIGPMDNELSGKVLGKARFHCFGASNDYIFSRWREMKYQYIGALGAVAAIKNVRSKRLS